MSRRLPATTTAPAWIQDLLAALAGFMPPSRAAWAVALRVAVLVLILHFAVVVIVAVGTWLWLRVRRAVGASCLSIPPLPPRPPTTFVWQAHGLID